MTIKKKERERGDNQGKKAKIREQRINLKSKVYKDEESISKILKKKKLWRQNNF